MLTLFSILTYELGRTLAQNTSPFLREQRAVYSYIGLEVGWRSILSTKYPVVAPFTG